MKPPDVCLLLEGTYPYVSGGVSSWVQDILLGHPHLRFALWHIGAEHGGHGPPRFVLPPNVAGLYDVSCRDARAGPLDAPARAALEREIARVRRSADLHRAPSRVIAALRRLHFEDTVDEALLSDLACGDLTVPELLHGREGFKLCAELADRLALDGSFLEFFWHLRSMHAPLLRLLAQPTVEATCYHAVSTGYAGVLGAVASMRTGRPLIVTEHGIYAREREMEMERADWFQGSAIADRAVRNATRTSLRRCWSHFFRSLSRCAYARASRIVTLSEANRRKQLVDGAPEAATAIIPNGIDVEALMARLAPVVPAPARRPMRVGFVGRLVTIKDVLTLIRACAVARERVDLDVAIIGPDQEDPAYALRCRDLVTALGLEETIRFVGVQPLHKIYGELDVLVLTSLSEGQPLVMLEAYAAGIPVIATDVGACREMIEGRTEADRALGPSGIVTPIASPERTADALAMLSDKPRLRRAMGAAGRARVSTFYHQREMIASYRALYGAMVSS